MAITNHDRVGKAMEHLKSGLSPFVGREFNTAGKGTRVNSTVSASANVDACVCPEPA
jgi:hypothetical protein